ncbi:LysR family transcriptional regulator substrate-binding protein [Streptomyces sp. YC504]|uniref:LysR family transcriptional regulator substrate-binding protein n=1 Tax=Streptomyces mesophilus TaxID=1775132 RepID=A0A6G4XI95_9ACTN|nr:LysR family transcriptional regulator substrate-binding protein [Streptomyces mesophilus]NGO76943.1 LysR family transcriptional regulator substrate-binding protein [Streptomyces mesophilus]
MTGSDDPAEFRLAYVPGATPAKWVRIWRERLPSIPLTLVAVEPAEAAELVESGGVEAGLLRMPVDKTRFNAIPLYAETTVAVVPKDHLVTAADEVTLADLADEIVLHPLDDTLGWTELPGKPALERPATTADAVELVAAGIGVLIAPQSLARLHHRKDLTYRPLTDAPESRMGLVWPQGDTSDLVEQFIGIVRGRTVNSSRGQSPAEVEAARGRKKQAKDGKGRGAAKGTSAKAGPRGGAGKGGARSSGSASGARRGKPKRRG